MEHLYRLKDKDTTLYNDELSSPVKVTLKVDGKPFQISLSDDGEIEYRGRSGNTLDLGPLITNYDRLFSLPTNNAIEYFDNHKEVLKDYKFLVFEVVKDIIFLLHAVTKDGKVVHDDDTLYTISKKLGVYPVPVLFYGMLSDEQQDGITHLIDNLDTIKGDAFKNEIVNLFGSYPKFPKELFSHLDNIEGVVINFYRHGQEDQYKIVDQRYTSSVKEYQQLMKDQKAKYAKSYESLYKLFVSFLSQHLVEDGKTYLEKLDNNFLNMLNDYKMVNQLFNIGSSLPVNQKQTYRLQLQYTNPKIAKYITKHGTPMQTVYEEYVKLFKAPKIRAFVISKDFQKNINEIIDKLKNEKP